jgi:hypothetical protein
MPAQLKQVDFPVLWQLYFCPDVAPSPVPLVAVVDDVSVECIPKVSAVVPVAPLPVASVPPDGSTLIELVSAPELFSLLPPHAATAMLKHNPPITKYLFIFMLYKLTTAI